MTLEEKVSVINKNYLFSALPQESLEIIALKTTQKVLSAGEILIEQDSLETIVYFIHTGAVRIYRLTNSGEEIPLATRGAGDVIGELSLFNQFTRTATVETVEKTEVLGLSAKDFLEVLYAYPEVSIILLQTLSARIDELGHKLELMA